MVSLSLADPSGGSGDGFSPPLSSFCMTSALHVFVIVACRPLPHTITYSPHARCGIATPRIAHAGLALNKWHLPPLPSPHHACLSCPRQAAPPSLSLLCPSDIKHPSPLPPPPPRSYASAAHFMGDLRQMATNAVAYNHPDKNPGGMESAMGTADQLVRVAEHALLTASADVKAAERAIRQEASKLVGWGGVGWPWAERALLRGSNQAGWRSGGPFRSL